MLFRSNIGVHAVILFAPPILLTFFTNSETVQRTILLVLFRNLATYLTTLVLSVLVYRVSPIHPLARYPGPIGCKISKFWLGIRSLSGFQHQYIRSMHERYGDFVRIGASCLSCSLRPWSDAGTHVVGLENGGAGA